MYVCVCEIDIRKYVCVLVFMREHTCEYGDYRFEIQYPLSLYTLCIDVISLTELISPASVAGQLVSGSPVSAF